MRQVVQQYKKEMKNMKNSFEPELKYQHVVYKTELRVSNLKAY